MTRYDPGPAGHPSVTRAALGAALDTIDWQMADASRVIPTFLAYMSDNYVGDYYIEGSLAHLATMVRECESPSSTQHTHD